MPIAGKYRLIDIPISNCIHSGLNRIFVLTQFNSVSLHRHIANTYKFDPFSGGFVEILAAQQTMQHETWYQGTADAVRRNIPYFTEEPLRPGADPLRRPALPDGLPGHDPHPPREQGRRHHRRPAGRPRTRPRSCGIMRIDADGRVIDFEEKPKTPEKLEPGPHRSRLARALGHQGPGPPVPGQHGHLPVQPRRPWSSCSPSSDATDFGKEIFPQAIARPPGPGPPVRRLLGGHRHGRRVPQGEHRPDARRPAVRLHLRRAARSSPGPRYLPCSRICGATVKNSLICRRLRHRPGLGDRELGDRRPRPDRRERRRSATPTSWGPTSTSSPSSSTRTAARGRPNVGIGAGSVIENAIIDKNARIGRNVTDRQRDAGSSTPRRRPPT